jgi:hypothetical protein
MAVGNPERAGVALRSTKSGRRAAALFKVGTRARAGVEDDGMGAAPTANSGRGVSAPLQERIRTGWVVGCGDKMDTVHFGSYSSVKMHNVQVETANFASTDLKTTIAVG